jgi:tetratricopeptide (TPR) repeat protein
MTDHPARGRPLLVAGALLGLVGVLVLARCERRDPEAAYLGADFLEARRHYNLEACRELAGEEAARCHERAQQITSALVGAAHYLGRRANERIRHTKQIQFNRYQEAIQSLEVALEILPAEHPSRPDFVAGIERIRKTQSSLEAELDLQLDKLRTMLETGTYDAAVWTDIRLTFERVRVLVLAIGKEDDRPRVLARELLDKFRRHGQYEHARIATQLTEAVEAGERAAPQYTDRELVLFGVIDHLAQQQEAARNTRIAALMREAVAAAEAKRPAVAAERARAVLQLGATGRTARQMQALIDKLEGAAGQKRRAEEARRVVAETPTEIEPVPLVEVANVTADAVDEVVSGDAPPSAARDETAPVDRRPPAQRLQEVVRQYEAHQLFEALAGLEALQRDVRDARDRKKVSRLRRVWTPDRLRLLTEIVDEADRLFVSMDEHSLTEYRRAQQLSPEGETARHIAERIETLERILSE